MLIVVGSDGTVSVRQFESSSECKKEWIIAKEMGLDAYYYLFPIKAKATTSLQGITQVTI